MSLIEIPASEAARQLGVHDSRVRRLIESGELAARKVANRWLVDQSAVERRRLGRHDPGRLLEPENAWGLLFLASGEPTPWLASDARSRLRRRLGQASLRRDHPRLAKRARAHYFRGGARARAQLLRDPQFVRSGVSAAARYGVRVRSPGVLEGYLPEAAVQRVAYRFALQPADERAADLVLRGVAGFWPFDVRRLAPRAVVAADLFDSVDQRTRRAGEEIWRRRDR